MTDELFDKTEFMVRCVNMFARTRMLSPKMSYLYLLTHGGIDYLEKHYEILKEKQMNTILRRLSVCCINNGGDLD